MTAAHKIRCIVASATSALSLVMLGQVATAASLDVSLSAGVPRIEWTSAGPELTRSMVISAETSLLRADIASTFCAQREPSDVQVFGAPGVCSGGAPSTSNAGGGEQFASLTWRLPRAPVSNTGLELAIVSWRNGVFADSTHGTGAEVRIAQSFRAIDFGLGHSEPLGRVVGGAWRSTWIAASLPISLRAHMQLVSEHSYEIVSGMRETRVTANFSFAPFEGMRGSLRITRSSDDSMRPWLAGGGLSWTF